MTLSIEDRLKFWFVPGGIYYPHKIRSETRAGEPELALLDRLTPGRDGTAVDVGANRGIYSYALSKLYSRVLAFEPNPELASFARGKLPSNVELHEVAVGARDDRKLLHIPHDGKGNTLHLVASLIPRDDVQAHQVSVAVRSLDSFDMQSVRFIKIDVEGAELDVLDGAARILERDRPVLLVELLAGHYKDPQEQIRAICRSYGYTAGVMGHGDILRSAENLEDSLSRNVIFATAEQFRTWSEEGLCQ